jgi:hypothetical protein
MIYAMIHIVEAVKNPHSEIECGNPSFLLVRTLPNILWLTKFFGVKSIILSSFLEKLSEPFCQYLNDSPMDFNR